MKNLLKPLLKNKIPLALFLVVSLFYFFFAMQTAQFSNDEAYFHLRQVENINSFGKPLLEDNLSYGGREILYPPLFHYFLAFFSIFFPLALVLKLIPAILIGFLALIAYLLAKEISGNEKASFFAALLTGFLPMLVSQTLNQVSVYSLVLPVVFYMIYCFIKIKDDQKYVWRFVILSFLLPFLHPTAFLFVLILVFYVLLIVSESISISRLRKEVLVFSSLLILLLEFLFYRKALLEHGIALVKGGIPPQLLPYSFQSLDVFLILYHLGVLTLVLGSFGVFSLLYQEKNKYGLLLVSVVLSAFLLLLLKFIDFFGGMLFLGVALGILSSIAFSKFFEYIAITKISHYEHYITIFVFIFVLSLSFIPSYLLGEKVIDATLSDEENNVFIWINENTPENATILADVDEGHFVTGIAKRKNIIDSFFLLAPKPLQRFEDIRVMYLTWSEARALSLFREYNINYIYLSKQTKQRYNFNELMYVENRNCFKKVQSNEKAELYQILC